MNLSTRVKAIMVLIIDGILGGFAPLFMKIALKELNPYQVLFLRFTIAALLTTPLIIIHLKKITIKKIMFIIPAGLLFSANVFFMIIGIQYTTSIVSQLFYLLTPVFVSFICFVVFKERVSWRCVLSMLICFSGSMVLIFQSIVGNGLIHSIGTFEGNVLILCGVISWSTYIVFTKRIGHQFDSHLFVVTNFVVAVIVSIFGLYFFSNTNPLRTAVQLWHSGLPVVGSILSLAILNSVLYFFLYQWSLKRLSAVIVASSSYLGPLSAAFFAIPFFGEKLSATLLLSATSIVIGSYLILTEKK